MVVELVARDASIEILTSKPQEGDSAGPEVEGGR